MVAPKLDRSGIDMEGPPPGYIRVVFVIDVVSRSGGSNLRVARFRVFDVEKKAFDREYANADKSDWLDRNPKSHFLYADTGHFDVMVRN